LDRIHPKKGHFKHAIHMIHPLHPVNLANPVKKGLSAFVTKRNYRNW